MQKLHLPRNLLHLSKEAKVELAVAVIVLLFVFSYVSFRFWRSEPIGERYNFNGWKLGHASMECGRHEFPNEYERDVCYYTAYNYDINHMYSMISLVKTLDRTSIGEMGLCEEINDAELKRLCTSDLQQLKEKTDNLLSCRSMGS